MHITADARLKQCRVDIGSTGVPSYTTTYLVTARDISLGATVEDAVQAGVLRVLTAAKADRTKTYELTAEEMSALPDCVIDLIANLAAAAPSLKVDVTSTAIIVTDREPLP